MEPEAHIGWFVDNVKWFEAIEVGCLSLPVPNCPGWIVEDVINHLSVGVGLGYPAAMATPLAEAFTGVGWPSEVPTGVESVEYFAKNMGDCIQAFKSADPDQECFTYAGPGEVKFWFRRAAVETAIHRIDTEETTGERHPLSTERLRDAIAEAVEFVFPLAATISDVPSAPIAVSCPELDFETRLVPEDVVSDDRASISGSGGEVLRALWGRGSADLEIAGDREVVLEWLSLPAKAFGSSR